MSKKLVCTKYPFLPLSIRVRVAKSKHLELDTQALIDTGFSGDIVVPATEELMQSMPGAYATWTVRREAHGWNEITLLGIYRYPMSRWG